MKSQKLPKYRRKTRNQNSFETLRPVDNEPSALIEIKDRYPDTISFWIEAYFGYEVTTSVSSQKVQKRDLALFRDFMINDCGRENRSLWSPRLSKAFAARLKKKDRVMGRAGYSDQTINRILAYLLPGFCTSRRLSYARHLRARL